MQSIIRLSLILLIIAGCQSKNNNGQNNPLTDSAMQATSASSPQPGSDRDEHNCIASAGYTWSEIRKECIRLWEAGDRFKAYGDNTDSTLAAYLITAGDDKSAELFLPGQKASIQLNRTDGSMDQKTMMRIYQNADSSAYVNFLPTQARYVLYVDRKPMFACPHPLK